MPFTFPTAGELFQGLTEAESRRIEHLCAERRYRKGAAIFSKGDSSDAMYIAKEGVVRLISPSEKGAETILHILKPGEVFGELLLSEDRRPFTAVAYTPATVTVLTRQALLSLLSSIPAFSVNFIRLLSRRLAKVERGIADFGHTWSYQRLGHTLLDLCREHGRETATGTLITLRLTHEDLANLIGTTRETVTNQLLKFRRLGLVRMQDGALLVRRPRLEEYLRNV